MKITEFKKLIREEIRKVIKEEESFGDDVTNSIAKDIAAQSLADQRFFTTWAKTQAAKQNIKSLSFQGQSMTIVSLEKMKRKGIITIEMIKQWKENPKSEEESRLYNGITRLVNQWG